MIANLCRRLKSWGTTAFRSVSSPTQALSALWQKDKPVEHVPRWRVELVANRDLWDRLLIPFIVNHNLQGESWLHDLREILTGQEQADAVLRFLTQHVQDARCKVAYENGMFVLYSSDFENRTDAKEVRDLAVEVVWILNGLIQLGFGRLFPSVTVRRIIETTSLGERRVEELNEPSPPAALPSDPVRLAESTTVEGWLSSALQDSKVAEALHYYANEANWFNLYKVYEVIRDDVGEPTIDHWQGKSKRKAFHATANTARMAPNRLRYDARHSTAGPGGKTAPGQQMTLEEAQGYVVSILLEWLRTK